MLDHYRQLMEEIARLNLSGRFGEAEEKIDAIIRDYPSYSWGYLAKGRQLNNDESLKYYRQAVHYSFREKRYKYLSQIFHEMALWFRHRLQLLEAINYYQLAIEYAPRNEHKTYAHLQFGLGSTMLLYGDYECGFRKYHYLYVDRDEYLRHFTQPWWRGELRAGENLYLHIEEPHGDYIMHFRFIRMLKPFFKKIYIETPKRMIRFVSNSRLLKENGEVDGEPDEQFQLVPKISPGPQTAVDSRDFSVHAQMSLLPYYARVTKDADLTKDCQIPYMNIDRTVEASLRTFFEQFAGKLKIAINWCGDATNPDERIRKLPYEKFVELAAGFSGRVQIFSVQKFAEVEKVKGEAEDGIIELGSKLDNGDNGFLGTAVVLKQMDLLITSDTALAHLGGSLGVPTWVLINSYPEWRWQLERTDSPWYSKESFRLIRQKTAGDWTGAFEEVRERIVEML